MTEVEGRGARPAIADVGLVGACEPGDELIVNAQAADLELGSGGFDIVHVNLTRGLGSDGAPGAHVMKLNYSSLQHAVVPVEGERLVLPLGAPVAVIALHGQLAPLCWAFAQAGGGRLGFVQTAGGALPGGHSRVVRDLRERGLLAAFVTAAPSYGGEQEAITTAGAIHHLLAELRLDAVVCGPGPGIIGSASALGHGGLSALDSAHAAAALGCPVVICPRMSSGDPRQRHRGLSHHTRTVLELLLVAVTVALPRDAPDPPELTGGAEGRRKGHCEHELARHETDLSGYAASGLPASTMGRSLEQDEVFFAAALAAGAELASGRRLAAFGGAAPDGEG